ncbi:hypothetical protein [Thalassotalea crassostreae]|uniref:hypothetical protein n=1 Tax=Thalassotalea crassostreae TaxID=1763536 RepID=UPI0012FE4464|nr:hypothetical protein [Thalassotalea crassostreae]
MYKKILIVGLLSALAWYFLSRSDSQPNTIKNNDENTTSTQTLPSKQKEFKSKTTLIDEVKFSEESETAAMICPKYDFALANIRSNKHSFIKLFATNLLLQGYERYEIFSALSYKYDLELARQWFRAVANVNFERSENIDLISEIEKQKYTIDVKRARYSRVNFKRTLTSVALERDDVGYQQAYFEEVERLANESANIAIDLWFKAFMQAAFEEDFYFADLALENFNSYPLVERNLFVQIRFREMKSFLMILKKAQFEFIMKAFQPYFPIYLEDQNLVESYQNKFSRIAAAHNLFVGDDIFAINDTENLPSPSIIAEFEQFESDNPLLNSDTTATQVCELSGQELQASNKTPTKRLTKQNALGTIWQSSYQLTCRFDEIEYKVAHASALLELSYKDVYKRKTLFTEDELMSLKTKIKAAPKDIRPYTYLSLYMYVPEDIKNEYYQQLEEHELFNKDPDFIWFMFSATNDKLEQKKMLNKYSQNLAPYTEDGRSLIFNFLQLRHDGIDFAVELINQSFPFKRDELSPDPLALFLQNIRQYRDREASEFSLNEKSLQLLELLIANSDVNEEHINIMARYEENYEQAFDYLMQRFPLLYPSKPDFIVEFACENPTDLH